MQITSIDRDTRNKVLYHVYVDKKFCFSIPEDEYLGLSLYANDEITEDRINYIKNTLIFRAAKSLAVKYVSLKLRSEKEVRIKLENERYHNETIDNVIEELKALGYINDKLYIQKYIYDRSKLKPKSKKMLKFELISKGLPEEDIDEALSDWKIDEFLVARGLVRKKFGKYDLKDEKIIKKVYSFLYHRGFSFKMANDILNEINNDSGK